MAQPTTRDFAHSIGRNVDSVANKDFNLVPSAMRKGSFSFRSDLPTITAAVTVSATAYFVYLGTTQRRLSAQKVQFHVSTAAVGTTQTGEVGLFSTPASPNGAAQILTKLMASGTLDDLTAAVGVKGNTTAFATTVDAGTHLWAGYRVAMTGTPTQPAVFGLTDDMSLGNILTLASAAAFTATATYAGGLIAVAASAPVWQCPALILTAT